MTDPRQTLRDAAEYLSEHGWTQDTYANKDGAACALGAIGMVTGDLYHGAGGWDLDYDYGTEFSSARNLLSAEIGDACIPKWNDAKDRTAEDVILAMKRAAE